MKTSSSQFLKIVKCMEKNGDLSKPAEGPFGRIKNYEKWAELIEVLNLDTSGERKSLEKWKKVWSDLKNNTKRKAAKIRKSFINTNGPQTKLVLTDLELRVLNVVGSQEATGQIEFEETYLESPKSVPSPVSSTPIDTKPNLISIDVEKSPSIYDTTEHYLSPDVEICSDGLSPEPEKDNPTSPSSSRRRRGFRQRLTSRRGFQRSPRVDTVTRRFLASDERWRNLFSKLATEHLRLRERELEQQAQWQALFSRCLNCVESFLK